MKKRNARELSRNQSILRFDVILQHDWPTEQCLLHIRVFLSWKTKSPCFDLFSHSLIKQIMNTHQTKPETGDDAICGLSLLLVLSFVPRGFSPGTPVFTSPQKPTFPDSNSTRNQVDEEPLCGCATSKPLFIYYFY